MSKTPYFFLEKHNSTSKRYEFCHPYIWDSDAKNLVPADLFPYNGCHDIFSIVENRRKDFPEMHGVHKGLPDNVSEKVKEEYQKVCTEWDGYNPINPIVYWFTYADMYIYLLENPIVPNDNDDDDDDSFMDNPLNFLRLRIDSFLNVIDEDWYLYEGYGSVRIIYWAL